MRSDSLLCWRLFVSMGLRTTLFCLPWRLGREESRRGCRTDLYMTETLATKLLHNLITRRLHWVFNYPHWWVFNLCLAGCQVVLEICWTFSWENGHSQPLVEFLTDLVSGVGSNHPQTTLGMGGSIDHRSTGQPFCEEKHHSMAWRYIVLQCYWIILMDSHGPQQVGCPFPGGADGRTLVLVVCHLEDSWVRGRLGRLGGELLQLGCFKVTMAQRCFNSI